MWVGMKRTKIVCTIGPSSSSPSVLKDMMRAGMDVARINFSHGSYDSNLELMEKVRAAAAAVGKIVAILQDLQGPKIRVGKLPPGGLQLIEGQMATAQAGVLTADEGIIPVPYDRLAHDVRRGDRLLLADGTMELEVLDVRGKRIRTKVLLGGNLISYKGINVPTVSLSAESMTEKDEQDLAFGLKQNVDFVALSFVRRAEDIEKLRQKIKRYLPDGETEPSVIVKIEKHEALEHFDEILAISDGIMVARGDLGLETPVSRLPVRQKEIIRKSLIAGKPVITATEMLGSMEHNPRPTRAEVSDVANAVIDHTDAVMLSGESAMGKYPVRTVQMMAEIIEHTEESPLDDLLPPNEDGGQTVPVALGAAAVELAKRVKADAILVTTESGYSARGIARFRPNVPLYAASESPRTQRQLALSWGVTPLEIGGYAKPEAMVQRAIEQLKKDKVVTAKNRLIIVSGLKRKQGVFDSTVRVLDL
jgi:pyruvate kinase